MALVAVELPRIVDRLILIELRKPLLEIVPTVAAHGEKLFGDPECQLISVAQVGRKIAIIGRDAVVTIETVGDDIEPAHCPATQAKGPGDSRACRTRRISIVQTSQGGRHSLLPELATDNRAQFDTLVTILALILARRDLNVVPGWAARYGTVDVPLATFLRVDDLLGPGIVIHHRPFDREDAIIVVGHVRTKGSIGILSATPLFDGRQHLTPQDRVHSSLVALAS